jgi:predicted dehydrogenase
MQKGNLSRRGFLSRSLAGLVGAGLPLWYARETLAAEQEKAAKEKKVVAAGDRLLMGAIGTGGQGTHIMRAAMGHKGVQFIAVCDVDAKRRDAAAKIVGKDCAQYEDFRELLDRKDIDAVTIGTPDHWHTLVALYALKQGKDIYCEKPLTLTVAEGQALVKVCRAKERVFQVGSQQRSDTRFRLACELVRNGRIGKVKTVETWIGANPIGGPFKPVPVPEGLNWDFWLGQTPKVDYVPQRCHYEFRWWFQYSGGKMTDWGAHHNDIAQWALGMDGNGPVAVEGIGTPPKQDPWSLFCYNCPPQFRVTYTYAGGAQLVCTSRENGVFFEGEDGRWIFVNRGMIEAGDKTFPSATASTTGLMGSPAGQKGLLAASALFPGRSRNLIQEPLPRDATRLQVSNDHMGNFLDCVRSRERPICDVEVGHRSVSVCHIGNIAMRLGKRFQWDPAKEQFDDAEANTWLSREMRAPWKLEG